MASSPGTAVLDADRERWFEAVEGSGSRRRLLVMGSAAAAAGAAAILLATSMAPEGSPTAARVLIVLAGLVAGFAGLRRLGAFVFGEGFDLSLWLSVLWVVVIGSAAIFADWLPLAESSDVSKTLDEATLQRPDLFSAHPLGTDRQGLDILGGVVYGARVSLTVAVGAIVIGSVVGGLIGVVAGWFGGKVDLVVRLLTDSMLAFPPLILLLAMVSVLEPNVLNVTLALGLLGVPLYIRLARVNTMVLAPREFVVAARALGARSGRIILRELVPNVLRPMLSYGFIVIGVLVVAEASLSFLGLSIGRPNPTWGNMIASGQSDVEKHPHLVFGPGVVLFLTVFAFNRIGDRARALWEPRRRAL